MHRRVPEPVVGARRVAAAPCERAWPDPPLTGGPSNRSGWRPPTTRCWTAAGARSRRSGPHGLVAVAAVTAATPAPWPEAVEALCVAEADRGTWRADVWDLRIAAPSGRRRRRARARQPATAPLAAAFRTASGFGLDLRLDPDGTLHVTARRQP